MSEGKRVISAPPDIAVDVDPPKATLIFSSKIPPDGGYGWVVVLASFFISFVVWGIAESLRSGVPESVAELPTASTSGRHDLMECVSLFVSPVACLLLHFFGFRFTVFLGGVFCSYGLVLSFFAPSVEQLSGSLDVCMGIGISLASMSSVVCVSGYFTSKRHAALAFALAGGSLGKLVLPGEIRAIFEALGLGRTFLVLSAVSAALCLWSFAFDVPERLFVTETSELDLDEYLKCPDTPRVRNQSKARSGFFESLSEILGLSFLADPAFVMTAASACAAGILTRLLFHLIPLRAGVFGIGNRTSTDLLTYFTFGDFIARFSCGLLLFRSRFPRSAEYVLSLAVCASSVILLLFCCDYTHFALVLIVAGAGNGFRSALVPVVLDSNHGAPCMSGTFALLRFLEGIGSLFCLLGKGMLQSRFGTEESLLFVIDLAFAAVFLGILLNVVLFIRKREKQDLNAC